MLRENVPHIERIEERTRRHLAGYCAQIENLDWNLGRILDALEETGLADNTHILFFSDHGEMMGSHGQFRKMSPYEESRADSGHFVRRAAHRHEAWAQRRISEKVCMNHVDFAPTSLGLCGIEKPDWMEDRICPGCGLPVRKGRKM